MNNFLSAILAGFLLLYGIFSSKTFFHSENSQKAAKQSPVLQKTENNRDDRKDQSLIQDDRFGSLFSALSHRPDIGDQNEEKSDLPKEETNSPSRLPVENDAKAENPVPKNTYLEALKNVDYLPIRNWNAPFIEISAKAVLAADERVEKFFYQKNAFERLPVASLTKLMTAMVVLNNYGLEEKIKISQAAVRSEGEMGGLRVGETLKVRDLLYVMLIESSNDAAAALSEKIGTEKFVELMNKKAAELNLKDTRFTNPSGIDGRDHYSSAFDLARLTAAALSYSLIWEILQTQETEVKSDADPSISNQPVFSHRLINSNKLLGVVPGVIGGKTGYTDLAGGCMILVVQFENFKVINVVLGANGGIPFLDRFTETEKLVKWLKEAYIWR